MVFCSVYTDELEDVAYLKYVILCYRIPTSTCIEILFFYCKNCNCLFVSVPTDDYFATIRDPERAFEHVLRGFETTRENMEERNIFCGAYNLLVLDNR